MNIAVSIYEVVISQTFWEAQMVLHTTQWDFFRPIAILAALTSTPKVDNGNLTISRRDWKILKQLRKAKQEIAEAMRLSHKRKWLEDSDTPPGAKLVHYCNVHSVFLNSMLYLHSLRLHTVCTTANDAAVA